MSLDELNTAPSGLATATEAPGETAPVEEIIELEEGNAQGHADDHVRRGYP